jgi:type IV secretory pathway component VirB8
MKEDMKASIESYIDQGKNWYVNKYLNRKVESFKTLLSLVCIVFSVCILHQNLNSSQDNAKINFPIYVDGNGQTVHNMKSLFKKGQSVSEMVATHMLQRYVKLRENYSPSMLEDDKWKNLLINVYGISTYKSFDEYLAWILPNENPQSSVLKYRFSSSVVTHITSVKITEFSNDRPISAVVNFVKTICDTKHYQCLNDNWTASIKFEMSDITQNLVESEKQNFFFKISDYNSSKDIN